MRRSIILFPKLVNDEAINEQREKYDPLVKCIAPHITLVFPFDSEIPTRKLREHLTELLKGVKRFELQMKDITGDMHEGYLFLNIKKGNDQIIELHDRLYSGMLKDFRFRKLTYFPHMTIGMMNDRKSFDAAVEELDAFTETFESIIDKVFVENIDEKENSIIEFSIDLE